MANYANLLATIAANIYTNGNNEVTAAMVKAACDSMVSILGAGYQFMGVATPATTPGNTDVKQFYIASTPGTYTNFVDSGGNAIEVREGEAVFLKYDTAWTAEPTGIGRDASADLESIITITRGAINSSGQYLDLASRALSCFLSAPFSISVAAGFKAYTLARYRMDNNGAYTFVDSNSFPASGEITDTSYKYRITFCKSDYVSNISPAEYLTIVSAFKGKVDTAVDIADKLNSTYPGFQKVTPTISVFQNDAIVDGNGAIISNQYTTGWTIYKVKFPQLAYHTRVILRDVNIDGSGIGVVSSWDSSGNLIKVLTTYYNRHYTAGEFTRGSYQDIVVDLSEVLNVDYLLISEANAANKTIQVYVPQYRGENQTKPLTVTVDINGGADFDSIKDAVEFCMDRSNPCTILINPGEYDILEEFGGAAWTESVPSSGNNNLGLKLGNGIRLIGNGNGVVIKALYAGTRQVITDEFSIFNAAGSFHLENLELVGQNIRYCVHDDMPASFNKNYRISYKNCKMTHLGTTSTTYTGVEPLGGGCRGDSVYEIDGCVFSAPTRPYGASYHNNSTSEKAKVLVKNCYFVDCTFMLYCYEVTGSEIEFIVDNNSLASAIEFVGSDPNHKLSLIDFNNEIRG